MNHQQNRQTLALLNLRHKTLHKSYEVRTFSAIQCSQSPDLSIFLGSDHGSGVLVNITKK